MDFKNKQFNEIVELIFTLIELKVTKALYEGAMAKASELTKKGLIQEDDPPDQFS